MCGVPIPFIVYIIFQCWPGNSSGKVLDYGPGDPGSILDDEGGGDFSSLLHVQTGPGVHSTSYQMSTGAFPRVKVAKRRTNPTSS